MLNSVVVGWIELTNNQKVNMDLYLKDRTAVVVGGASGIGLATAECFAAEGTNVAIWDNADTTQRVAEELATRFHVRTVGVSVDVTNEQSVSQAVPETTQSLGPIDHLVNCAAIGSGKFGFPFTNLKPADWPRILEVNIMGMVHVAHAIAPSMIKNKKGTLIFLASVAGQIGSQTDPPYSASKAANINFSQCLAKDLAPHGVRVNSICPGMVRTPLNRSVWQAWYNQTAETDRLSYEDWTDMKIKAVVPLGKWQSPADIANMIVFLSSDRAANVTGQTINVDGGFVMHW
jgi:2-hydroxycyclohexanecarboxyl-CoA dehydrogenase